MPVKPLSFRAGSLDCTSKYQCFFVQLSHPKAAVPAAPPLFALAILNAGLRVPGPHAQGGLGVFMQGCA